MGEHHSTQDGQGSATRGVAQGRRGARRLRALLVAALTLAGLGLGAAAVPNPAAAAGPAQPTLVSDIPTTTTPHVTNGNVYTVAVVGNSVVLGGDFTASTDPDGTVVNRSYLLAFDRATGRIRQDWAPVLDSAVYSVVAAPDGQSVYVGGRFNRVNGAVQYKVARVAMSNGANLPFQSGVSAVVTAMALQGGRLYIGGTFTAVQGRARRVAALNAGTGAIDDNLNLAFEGTHNGGEGKIWRIEASNDGQHVVVVGSFASVAGQPRNQIAKLNVAGTGPVTLSAWATSSFAGICGGFTDYVRDVSFSPDSSYFVVATTGGPGTRTAGTCDSVTRFADTETANSTPSWTEYSGGDSYYSVEVTGSVVYVGGHFRWSNNSYGADFLGPGGSVTTGIASLDPTNGLPLSWNPGRDRGRAVWQMEATPDGLYVASDTDRIAGGRYRGRIAFFPLAGGRGVPQPVRPVLPLELNQYVTAGSPTRVVTRAFDGTTAGTPQARIADASALAGARAAFFADGTLYSAHSDGTLQARSYDGTTLGAASTIDLQRMTDFADDLRNMRSMVLDDGRLYYTRDGSSQLYMRYFSVQNRVVGAQRFEVASSGGGVQYDKVGGMVLAGANVYYVDLDAGTLVRATWRPSGGIEPAGRTTVSAADAGGVSWTTSVLWARQGQAANQSPTASFTATCVDGRCSVDGRASTDPDGTIASYAWNFGDGSTATGPTAARTYTQSGTYTIQLTVTDNGGLTATTTRVVTVAVPADRGFLGTTASTTGRTSTTHSVLPDEALRAGDQMLLFVTTNAPSTTTVTPPPGWTTLVEANTSGKRTTVLARTATATDPGLTYTVGLSVAARADVVFAAYRGLRANPASAASFAGYTTPTVTAPSGAWAVSFWADKSSTTTGWTVPADVTLRHSFAGAGSGHTAEALADSGGALAGGPYGGRTASVASPVFNSSAVTIILALA